jgi:8-oxo-dGTP pyrophosphatase MutT (NUDIX family)
MTREFSAGGIVFKSDNSKALLNDQGQVLLTQNSANHHWGFPKGHIEKGQTSKEAALREVKEEGGVEAEIIAKIDDSKYIYTHPETKEKIFKVVTFYLMNYLSGDPQNHDWEVSEAGWFTPEEALKKLSFSDDKRLLKKALEMKGVPS